MAGQLTELDSSGTDPTAGGDDGSAQEIAAAIASSGDIPSSLTYFRMTSSR